MNFQNPSMPQHAQFRSYALHQKACTVKMSKVTRATTHEIFFLEN